MANKMKEERMSMQVKRKDGAEKRREETGKMTEEKRRIRSCRNEEKRGEERV